MADLVVGMAKSVVEGTLSKAQAAIEEEGKLRQSAQRNLVFIAAEFQMMQSFLHVADDERLKNAVVKTWVMQIRDLAYDVEDCIEFVVHLDKRNRWWVRLLQPVRWAMPCLAPLQLDEAVDELDRLKARVEEVSMRNTRYSLISDSGSKPSSTAEAVNGTATAFNRLIRATTDAQKSWQGDLTQLLAEKEGGGVISVWGTGRGDLGTTSIVWSAYTDHQTSFACRAWVKLRHPFNPDEFVRSLMAQFYAQEQQQQQEEEEEDIVPVEKMKAGQGHLLDEFVRYVKEKRFLVVLEDLSTMEEWNTITTFFPKRKQNNGSCIIVSTQQFEVASLSVGHPYHVRHLSKLSDDHSVYAFFKMESQRDGDNTTPDRASKKQAAEQWIKDHGLVGRESAVKDLDSICSKKACRFFQVMSVWGIAGIGKSVLVKHLFCDKIRKSKVYENYAWVELSNPFNLWDFCQSLLLSFESQALQIQWTANHGTMGSKNPIVECCEKLKSTCFIIIDGLQSTEEWDMIQDKLVSGSNPKNVVIVITTDEKIATHCRGPKGPLTYNVKALEPEAAFQLFKKESNMGITNIKLQELVSKCGGIPKVIVEIAVSMAKRKVKLMERAGSINDKFVKELETNREFDSLLGLFDWMQSYFRNCPDSLKPCIFYLSIFSPKQLIRRRRLVRRWIAEGYSRDSHDNTAEENGEEQFCSLLNLSIIQQPSSVGLGGNRMVSCGVNGFFREYIVSRRLEENLVFELDGSCAPTTQRTGRHLVIAESWVRDEIVYKSIDFSKLRSLTVSGEWESFFISESMKMLRVLDLEDALKVEYSDLKKIVKWFPRLKFLSLRGHTEICHLPSSIGDLRQLQSLDLSKLTTPAVSGLSKIAKMNLEMDILKKEDVNSLGELPELCILRLYFQQLEGDELKFHTITHTYEDKSYLKLKVLEIACSRGSSLTISFGEKTMKELERLKVDSSSWSSGRFSGLENLPELKEVLLNGSHVETSKIDQSRDQA
ncbi:hypothetical protein ACQ4PT_052931 [Festuca glaucescens]